MLVRYPFIYDPASKSRLLAASNNRSQWEEFQNAFLESLTQGGGMPYMLLRVSSSPDLCRHKEVTMLDLWHVRCCHTHTWQA